jgi:hypothetical protein
VPALFDQLRADSEQPRADLYDAFGCADETKGQASVPSHQSPDGRWHHTFSASWLKDYATCPEKARRRYFNITAWHANSYTALGSAVHAGIEAALEPLVNGEVDPLGSAPAFGALVTSLKTAANEPGYTGSMEYAEMLDLANVALEKFFDHTFPHMQPLVVEEKFDLPFYEDAFRSIRLRGAIDCVDRNLGIIDWKTAGSPHKVWEKERYEVQPTVYVWAWNKMHATNIDHMRYVVFVHNKGVQEYTVAPKEGAVDWLAFKALGAARHVESGLPVWATNDSGWWCSAKWCAAYEDCKGLFVKEAK